jgi:parallel beta-helix repeat protein
MRHTLLALDGHVVDGRDEVALKIGASAQPVPPQSAAGRPVAVANPDQLRVAIGAALPGDVITLAAGTYRFRDSIAVRAPGSAANPVSVRAELPGTVTIEFDTVEGFAVAAPYWQFENLTIRGVCADHSGCEHAFHVTGGAHHFVALNNTVIDFNAQFKINGADGRFPDAGRIEGNTVSNSTVRRTNNPVTPIDLVGASDWIIRRNLIADFIKQGGDQVSYGAFAKGAGTGNVFEQNIVWCERRLQGEPGQRVGLSLGGGGSGASYCRDRVCITEQDRGVIRSNLVASCSDDGIYLNSAARSVVAHNTVLGTAGVTVRYPTSSAELDGNLVDGAIRSRNDGILRARDNLESAGAWQFVGRRPLRALFSARSGDPFAWSGSVPRRDAGDAAPPDLCGMPRPRAPAYGAFEDFAACVARP